jgi:hypothetical protein
MRVCIVAWSMTRLTSASSAMVVQPGLRMICSRSFASVPLPSLASASLSAVIYLFSFSRSALVAIAVLHGRVAVAARRLAGAARGDCDAA